MIAASRFRCETDEAMPERAEGKQVSSMGATIGIVVLMVVCMSIGMFIAGANPETAAKWDAWRRKALGL